MSDFVSQWEINRGLAAQDALNDMARRLQRMADRAICDVSITHTPEEKAYEQSRLDAYEEMASFLRYAAHARAGRKPDAYALEMDRWIDRLSATRYRDLARAYGLIKDPGMPEGAWITDQYVSAYDLRPVTDYRDAPGAAADFADAAAEAGVWIGRSTHEIREIQSAIVEAFDYYRGKMAAVDAYNAAYKRREADL